MRGAPEICLEELEGLGGAPLEGDDYVDLQNEIVLLLSMMANAGASTHRVEEVGRHLCEDLGLTDVQIGSLPGLLTVSFDATSSERITRTVSTILHPGLSLSRMEAVDHYIGLLRTGQIPKGFLKALRIKIESTPVLFGIHWQAWIICFCNGACALGFFGATWPGVLISFLIGLVIFAPLTYVSTRWPSFALVTSPVASFCAGFFSYAAVCWGLLLPGCLAKTELSSIITLAPGLSLALAALELSSRSIVSGTSRLVGALTVSFLIGMGLAFGEEISQLIFGAFPEGPHAPCPPFEYWWLFLSFPSILICFFVLLDAPPFRWVVMALVGALAFGSSLGLSFTPLSTSIQTVIASFLVGIFSIAYGYFTENPISTVVFSGVIFLVPGALSIATFQNAIVGGAGFAFGIQFLAISVSVALGILIASVPSFSRRELYHSRYIGVNSLV